MGKNDCIQVEGVVVDSVRDTFTVKLQNGSTVTAKPSGKLRIHSIRLLVGDPVVVELSIYDLTKGRIVYRKK